MLTESSASFDVTNDAADMPLHPSFSQTSSSAKKQQSISNFFGKASTQNNSSEPRQTPPKATEASLFVGEHEQDGEESDQGSTEPHDRKRRKLSSKQDNAEATSLRPSDGNQRLNLSTRTSRYAFSSSPPESCDTENLDSDEARAIKEKLHQRFVEKLGRPGSLAERRRNRTIDNGVADQDQDGEVEEAEEAEQAEEEEDMVKPAQNKKATAARKTGKLTPMEKQILEIKRTNLDTLLIIEVGYKFKFIGEDARTVAKELSIVCIPGKFRYDEHPSEAHLDRFASASIPVHRLHVHVKRLVGAGYKVR